MSDHILIALNSIGVAIELVTAMAIQVYIVWITLVPGY